MEDTEILHASNEKALDDIQDSDALKEELDSMLGNLTQELEDLVSEVNAPTPEDKDMGEAKGEGAISPPLPPSSKKTIKEKAFLQPISVSKSTRSDHTTDMSDNDMSGSEEEEDTPNDTSELHHMLKSVEVNSQEEGCNGVTDTDNQTEVHHAELEALQNAVVDVSDIVSCTVEEFLAEDNGFAESDEDDDNHETNHTDTYRTEEGENTEAPITSYWSSVGSYATAGWGLAASSLAKATEISKTSIAATKASLAGKVSSLKVDPAVLAKWEQVHQHSF